MILVVDDSTGVRRVIRSLIEDVDPDIVECGSGEEAIATYNSNPIDLVVMDINMHPIDGLTAMRTVLETDPDAKIVIVSQYQDARTRTTALAMGAHAFVGKEDLTQLRDLIVRGNDRSEAAIVSK